MLMFDAVLSSSSSRYVEARNAMRPRLTMPVTARSLQPDEDKRNGHSTNHQLLPLLLTNATDTIYLVSAYLLTYSIIGRRTSRLH